MSKIIIYKQLEKDLPNATTTDSCINLVQQTLLKSFKNKLMLFTNEVTDALNELYAEEKIIEKAIKDKKDKEKKNV